MATLTAMTVFLDNRRHARMHARAPPRTHTRPLLHQCAYVRVCVCVCVCVFPQNQLHTFNDVCNNESLVSDTET